MTIRCACMLTDQDRRVIDFERCWWLLPGPKDRDIHEVFGFGAADYYRILRGLIDDPDALSYDPLTMRRLRRRIRSGRSEESRPGVGMSRSGHADLIPHQLRR